MTPLDLSTVTPGVRRLVGALRAAGFETTDSGDGVENVAAGVEGACDFPMVVIQVEPSRIVEEADRLARWLATSGVTVQQQGPDPSTPCIVGSYDPAQPDVGVLLLTGVDDGSMVLP